METKTFQDDEIVSFIDKYGNEQICYIMDCDDEQGKSLVESSDGHYWVDNSQLSRKVF